jgi:hypothetical protein
MARLFRNGRDAAAAAQRAIFLNGVAAEADARARAVAAEADDPARALARKADDEARALAAIRALTEAAAFRFALHEAEAGRDLLGTVVDRIEALPPERRSLPRLALIGALAGRVETRLAPAEVVLSGRDGPPTHHRWDWVDPRQAAALLAAALLSGQRGEALRGLLLATDPAEPGDAAGEDAAPPVAPALVALALSPLAGLLDWFAVGPDDAPRPDWMHAEALGVVRQVEARWRLRLRLMLQQPERRALMVLPDSVVDWPLLAVTMALRATGWREPPGAARPAFDAPGPDGFHAALAVEMQGSRPRR